MRHRQKEFHQSQNNGSGSGSPGPDPKSACSSRALLSVASVQPEALIDPLTERNKSDGSRESLGPPREPAMRPESRTASCTAQALGATPAHP